MKIIKTFFNEQMNLTTSSVCSFDLFYIYLYNDVSTVKVKLVTEGYDAGDDADDKSFVRQYLILSHAHANNYLSQIGSDK
jgi:hypothetical protein